ncbi:helix-turn-helix domain-containing protein [Bacillus kwashiorkori]|uniref:helix-turn-helix domain-containing protein n=1 Tax=Bacillus kwashiorkori TaxID=1522318 RepID=UPI0007855A5B|nr:helix-turn-helix transcriptional regulator [Bacillus kwashiorkori]
METEKWGRRIRAFRKLKGYTQSELAKEVGVTISIIGEIERGNRIPSDRILTDIATVLQIKKEELGNESKV